MKTRTVPLWARIPPGAAARPLNPGGPAIFGVK